MSTRRHRSGALRRTTQAAGALVVAGACLAAPSPAHAAACQSSTPSSAAFADALDATGAAPEIGTVRVAIDGACRLTVDSGVVRSLAPGAAVLTYIDADGDATTGDPVFGGADVAVGVVGRHTGVPAPLMARWNGGSFSFKGAASVGTATATGGFTASVDRLSLVAGATIHVTVVSVLDDDTDAAPEFGEPGLALQAAFSTGAGPDPVIAPVEKPTPESRPLPVTTPATGSGTPSTGQVPSRVTTPAHPSTQAAQRCRVPSIKGLTVPKARAKLRAAGCAVAAKTSKSTSRSVKAGRVIRTSVAAGTRTSKTVRLVVSRGAKARATR